MQKPLPQNRTGTKMIPKVNVQLFESRQSDFTLIMFKVYI